MMSIYDGLNDKQREAVFQTEGPVLILAGAGSGKTRVLTHRIAYLIEEKGVNPWNIMAITFTNKAAQEMRERVDQIVGFGSESVWVSTFHASCVRILRRYIEYLGFAVNFSIYDTEDQKSVIKEVCRRCEIDTKNIKERMILSAISKAKNEMISPEDYQRDVGGDFIGKKIAAAYKEYQIQLKKNNALDFDDLLCKTVELFETNPDILLSYQKRFRYIMVDEYQDTNSVQFRFINLLAGKEENICVVGDDDQSIYRFRGADIGNILGFEHVFPRATVIKLEQNYRSTKTILNAANQVIRNNTNRKDKTLWTEQAEGEKICLMQCENAYQEAEGIVNEIQGRVKANELEYKDCAVLYRTNAQSRALEEQFVRANIPYRIFGGINFYSRKEIKDLLAYLKTIDNGRDDLSVKRIINIPRRGIGAATIDRVQNFAEEQGISFYDALRDAEQIPSLGRSVAKLESFVKLIQVFRSKLKFMSLKDFLKDIIDTIEYRKEFDGEDEEEIASRNQNIDELISKIADYEEKAENPVLSEFLEEVALVADIDNLDASNNHVVLMTLHSAKGLEFPKVFLCGMEEGLFPSYLSATSDQLEDLEEERRLCYVGITRAMKSLTVSFAKQRMIRGEIQYNRPSRFLKEIPPDLMEGAVSKPRIEKMPMQTAFSQARAAFQAKPFADRPKQQFGSAGKDTLEYGVGDTVFHIKFGRGVVKEIVSGGRDFEVTVEFEKAGVRKMFASFAKLKKI